MKRFLLPILISLLLLMTLTNLSLTVFAACYPDGCEALAEEFCDEVYCVGPLGGCDGVTMWDTWCIDYATCASIWWLFCNEGSGYGRFYCEGDDWMCT
jgi:hypothetical protein